MNRLHALLGALLAVLLVLPLFLDKYILGILIMVFLLRPTWASPGTS